MMTRAVTLRALGYIGIRAKALDDWASYGAGLLGLQRVDQSRATLAFRMDDRKQRVVVHADGGEGIGFFGWEVADAATLDALAARLDNSGIAVARGTRALADERHVADLIVLADPLGNRLELFRGAQTATEPFRPGRCISGFRTGPLGLGHIFATQLDAARVGICRVVVHSAPSVPRVDCQTSFVSLYSVTSPIPLNGP